jgi:hypothetical protein
MAEYVIEDNSLPDGQEPKEKMRKEPGSHNFL